MKIIVLAGGYSRERDVSLSSGASICRALREKGHKAYLLDAFLGLEGITAPQEVFDLEDAGLCASSGICATEPDLSLLWESRPKGLNGFLGPNVLKLCAAADVTFIALHGGIGENGKLQAAFDVLGIRYTGSGSLGCALSMDKGVTKEIFKAAGISAPSGARLLFDDREKSPETLGLKLPLVIKPCSGGSSIGVYFVRTEKEYRRALSLSFLQEEEVVAEPLIDGREYACSVFDGRALPIVEIIPSEGFFDYAHKYQKGGASEICPAVSLSPSQSAAIREAAERAFSALRLSVYARADFLVDNRTGEIFCLEVNSLPGMTSTSLLPQAAKAAGYEYGDFCELILQKSLELRYQSNQKKGESLR